VPALEKLAKKYDDLEVWHLYVEEPHPQERKFKKYTQHENYEHRLAYAKELREILKIESPIVLDDLDGEIHHRYGYMPNMVYLIDKSGKVAYKANWTDSRAIDQILAQLGSEAPQSS